MAALKIAHRNAMLGIVPRAYWQPIVQKCIEKCVGDMRNFPALRENSIAWAKKNGVKLIDLMRYFGKSKADQITAHDLVTLRGFKNALAENGGDLRSMMFPDGPQAKPPPPMDTDGMTQEETVRAKMKPQPVEPDTKPTKEQPLMQDGIASTLEIDDKVSFRKMNGDIGTGILEEIRADKSILHCGGLSVTVDNEDIYPFGQVPVPDPAAKKETLDTEDFDPDLLDDMGNPKKGEPESAWNVPFDGAGG